MTYKLIIAEKPSAARKIASSLADSAVKNHKNGQVTYHELKRGKDDIIVTPAVGHLYGLRQIGKSWTYPVFDVEWVPSYEINKDADYIKKYLSTIKKLAKDADDIIVATDLDIEGETIAYNIIRYACKKENAKRMKFSTMTEGDLKIAYDDAAPSIIIGLANAGVVRHTLDFYFGINISRALTLAVKSTGRHKILSSGRVQGPALAFLAKRELEIAAFKSDPFWQIEAELMDFKAMHEKDKIWNQEEAEKINETCSGHNATITDVKSKQFKSQPPTPFNLTDLQVEAHKLFKITPRETQQIAQDLYLSAAISYPRTSSQKLPEKLGYRAILEKLRTNKDYHELCDKLLAMKTLKPNEGKKDDDAHVAIYPTGERPTDLNPRKRKIYDLIVKRFFATFGEAAIRETTNVKLDINGEGFVAQGAITVEKNWFELYDPYVNLKEEELPMLSSGEVLHVKQIEMISKETQPPNRYNQSSIIRELEKRDLGTKATRAEIVNNLYVRGYLKEKRIEVTELGLKVIETLEKYSPDIISEDLTRRFEREMESIEHGKCEGSKVLDEAKEELTKILISFKENEKQVGEELITSINETIRVQTTVGKCKNCDKGDLILRRGKFGMFIGCNNYPDCKTIFNIPKGARVAPTDKICEKCGLPMILVTKPRSKPQEYCINPDCETRKVVDEEGNAVEKETYPEVGMQCPNCEKGKMILRKSFYGQFLGCDNYPKCKTMMKIENGTVNTTPLTPKPKAARGRKRKY